MSESERPSDPAQAHATLALSLRERDAQGGYGFGS